MKGDDLNLNYIYEDNWWNFIQTASQSSLSIHQIFRLDFIWKVHLIWLLKYLRFGKGDILRLLVLLPNQLRDKLVRNNKEDDNNTNNLPPVRLMMEVKYAQSHCDDLPCCYYEGNEVLFKLLYHPVDYHLPDCWKNAHWYQMHHE